MAVTATLQCTKCKAIKPETGFDRNKLATKRNGRHQWCKSCRAASLKARYAADPDKYKDFARWGSIKHRFGLTQEQYQALADAQGNVCAICREPERSGRYLSVDHDHGCCPGGKTCGNCVRGLLCNTCNRLLGLAEDNIDRLLAAAAYLGS